MPKRPSLDGTIFLRRNAKPFSAAELEMVMVGDDRNKKALRQLEQITESDPGKGKDLLESPRLKRAYRELRKRLAEPARRKPVK